MFFYILLNVLLKSLINGGHGDASSGLLAYKEIVVCIILLLIKNAQAMK